MKRILLSLMCLGTSSSFAQNGMGVGNNNPLEMLHVSGAIKVGTDFTNGPGAPAGGAGVIRFRSGQFEGWDGSTWSTLGGGGTDADWTISGSNQYSAVTGNVGIGATTPLAKLHVDGAAELFRLRSTADNSTLSRVYVNSSPRMDFTSFAATGGQLTVYNGSGTYSTRIGSGGDSYFRFGNVGIGTDAPQQKLHVEVSGSSGQSYPILVKNIAATNAGGTGSGIGFINHNVSSNPKAAIYNERTADYGLGKMHFLMNNTSDGSGVNLSTDSRLTILSNGNIGIGTSSPASKLDINGNSSLNDNQLRLRNGSDGNHYLSYIGGSFDGAKLTGNNNVILNTITGGDALIVTGNRVGIGTSSPIAPLHVESQASAGYGNFTYYAFQSNAGSGSCCGGTVNGVSVHASGRMMASEFDAFSDARIKNVQGVSNSVEDLTALLGIEITDYTMIDKAKDIKPYKKVIAQQVETVYPQAVSKITDVVPNIYKVAFMDNGYIQLSTDLQVGSRVRLIFDEGPEMVKVIDTNSNGFYVDTKKSGNVFVYGEEVSDFRTVDYEAISMLNVSATQQLFKLITELSAENLELKAEVTELKQLGKEVEALKNWTNFHLQSSDEH